MEKEEPDTTPCSWPGCIAKGPVQFQPYSALINTGSTLVPTGSSWKPSHLQMACNYCHHQMILSELILATSCRLRLEHVLCSQEDASGPASFSLRFNLDRANVCALCTCGGTAGSLHRGRLEIGKHQNISLYFMGCFRWRLNH